VRRRNVTLRRASGEVVPVDLVRFEQTGDASANPVLREGDAVVVPTVDERVQIVGRVHYAGAYEFRRGESLAELLIIANAGGGFPAEAGDTVRLVRYLENGSRTVVAFSREEAIGARGRAFVLQPFDGVYVPSTANFRVMKTATVAGQVINPGTFPIRPDTTPLRELVAMAGGFTPEASLVGATLRRQPPTPGNARDEMANIPPELLTEEDRRILQVRNSSDATRVVVDLAALFAAGSDVLDLPVRNGDVLTVPSRRFDVSVLGAVRDPGLVPHRPGAGVGTYLAAAGGLAQRADRRHVVVLKAGTGARVSMFEVRELEPGDAVIVPFRKETTALGVLQIAQAVVGTIAGLVLTAVAVFR
jgi:protein involved in polysaccharide export with SLBB domain